MEGRKWESYLPMRAFSLFPPPTRMALTMVVMIPSGPIARRTLSAQLMLILRNCLVTCSPKRVSSGARSLKRLLEKSSPSNSWDVVGAIVGVFRMSDEKKDGKLFSRVRKRCPFMQGISESGCGACKAFGGGAAETSCSKNGHRDPIRGIFREKRAAWHLSHNKNVPVTVASC